MDFLVRFPPSDLTLDLSSWPITEWCFLFSPPRVFYRKVSLGCVRYCPLKGGSLTELWLRHKYNQQLWLLININSEVLQMWILIFWSKSWWWCRGIAVTGITKLERGQRRSNLFDRRPLIVPQTLQVYITVNSIYNTRTEIVDKVDLTKFSDVEVQCAGGWLKPLEPL